MTMRYALYEDPETRLFAWLRVPSQFVEGDTFSVVAADTWFDTKDSAIAAVPELLNRTESDGARQEPPSPGPASGTSTTTDGPQTALVVRVM